MTRPGTVWEPPRPGAQSAAERDPVAVYLGRLRRCLAQRVGGDEMVIEIAEHLADARDDLIAAGVTPPAASARAVAEMGAPRLIARRLPRCPEHPHHWANLARRGAVALAAVSVAGLATAAARAVWGSAQPANVLAVYVAAGFAAIVIFEQLRGREPAAPTVPPPSRPSPSQSSVTNAPPSLPSSASIAGGHHVVPLLGVLAVVAGLAAAGTLALSVALSVDLFVAAVALGLLAERDRRRAHGAPRGVHS